MLIYDLVDPQELLGFVRGLEFEAFNLNRFLPDNNIEDIEYRFRRGELLDEDAAMFRAWDVPAPIGKRQGITRVQGELPPLSKKILLGEEERLRIRALETGNNSALIDQIFNDAERMIRAIQARVELARGQAIYDGRVVINENGVVATVDFGIPAAHRVAPATLWSNTAATVVQDIRGWIETYIDTTGEEPGIALTSTRVQSNLLRNSEIRTLAGSLAGTPALVTPQTVAAVFQAFGLPPMVVNDTKVRVAGVATRVIPDDRFILLPNRPMGQTLFGITAEALELAEEGQIELNQAPGLVAVIEKTFDPVHLWTKGAGIALPVVADGNFILTADVL